MNHIIVIGTVPPCPRCRLLTEIVIKKSELIGLDAEVRHISYTCDEAAEFAYKFGLVPGTAKDVAKITGKEINLEKRAGISELPKLDHIINLDPDLKPFENLFKEVYMLDNWLRSFENQAKSAGVLMTPILIINGEIKHQGSVPDLTDIEKWLSELIED